MCELSIKIIIHQGVNTLLCWASMNEVTMFLDKFQLNFIRHPCWPLWFNDTEHACFLRNMTIPESTRESITYACDSCWGRNASSLVLFLCDEVIMTIDSLTIVATSGRLYRSFKIRSIVARQISPYSVTVAFGVMKLFKLPPSVSIEVGSRVDGAVPAHTCLLIP